MTRMQEADLRWEKFLLQRDRWRVANDIIRCHPEVKPAELDRLDGEIASIEKALSGLGAA
jgi:hypothetical protein